MTYKWAGNIFLLSGMAMAAGGLVPFCFLIMALGNGIWGVQAYLEKNTELHFISTILTILNLLSYWNNL
jgi:hypothetical protein